MSESEAKTFSISSTAKRVRRLQFPERPHDGLLLTVDSDAAPVAYKKPAAKVERIRWDKGLKELANLFLKVHAEQLKRGRNQGKLVDAFAALYENENGAPISAASLRRYVSELRTSVSKHA